MTHQIVSKNFGALQVNFKDSVAALEIAKRKLQSYGEFLAQHRVSPSEDELEKEMVLSLDVARLELACVEGEGHYNRTAPDLAALRSFVCDELRAAAPLFDECDAELPGIAPLAAPTPEAINARIDSIVAYHEAVTAQNDKRNAVGHRLAHVFNSIREAMALLGEQRKIDKLPSPTGIIPYRGFGIAFVQPQNSRECASLIAEIEAQTRPEVTSAPSNFELRFHEKSRELADFRERRAIEDERKRLGESGDLALASNRIGDGDSLSDIARKRVAERAAKQQQQTVELSAEPPSTGALGASNALEFMVARRDAEARAGQKG